MLIATIFLNRTGGDRAIPLALTFLNKWPNPETLSQASEDEIAEHLRPLGLHRRRAKVIIKFTGNIVLILKIKLNANYVFK